MCATLKGDEADTQQSDQLLNFVFLFSDAAGRCARGQVGYAMIILTPDGLLNRTFWEIVLHGQTVFSQSTINKK